MKNVCLSYQKIAGGQRYDVQEHADRESARVAALESQHFHNRDYAGTPYPYYVLDEFGNENRADHMPAPVEWDR